MQHVAQAATHPTIALANAKTIQNKQYNKISPVCAAINLATMVKACKARQRCRYMMGTTKLAINAHARTKRIITNTNAAIADITYTSSVRRKSPFRIAGSTSGNESSPARINRPKRINNEKRK